VKLRPVVDQRSRNTEHLAHAVTPSPSKYASLLVLPTTRTGSEFSGLYSSSMTARHRVFPSAFCSPRALLDQPSYSFVDSALKDLKVHSRRLRIVLAAYSDELHIFERLYYKSKNQHRAGLFWRRVAEIRRYGSRLDGMHIPNIVQTFRCSFFGEASQQT
jgi:hypothetical protein